MRGFCQYLVYYGPARSLQGIEIGLLIIPDIGTAGARLGPHRETGGAMTPARREKPVLGILARI